MARGNAMKGSDRSINLSSRKKGNLKSMFSSFKYSSLLCCFKFRKQTNISILKHQIVKLKENFGVDYLTLVEENASVDELKECLRKTLEELDNLQAEIKNNLDEIEGREQKVNGMLQKKRDRVSFAANSRPVKRNSISEKIPCISFSNNHSHSRSNKHDDFAEYNSLYSGDSTPSFHLESGRNLGISPRPKSVRSLLESPKIMKHDAAGAVPTDGPPKKPKRKKPKSKQKKSKRRISPIKISPEIKRRISPKLKRRISPIKVSPTKFDHNGDLSINSPTQGSGSSFDLQKSLHVKKIKSSERKKKSKNGQVRRKKQLKQ